MPKSLVLTGWPDVFDYLFGKSNTLTPHVWKLKMKRFCNESGIHDKVVTLIIQPRTTELSVADVVHSITLAKIDEADIDFVSGYTYLYELNGVERIIRL